MNVKGKLIREARMKKDFSQEYLANVLGISQSQYYKLENGDVSFDIQKLGQLLDELELNPLEIIEFSEKQQTFINSHNSHSAIVNSGEINSPLIYNDLEAIRKIIHEELSKKK